LGRGGARVNSFHFRSASRNPAHAFQNSMIPAVPPPEEEKCMTCHGNFATPKPQHLKAINPYIACCRGGQQKEASHVTKYRFGNRTI
jgi:hypothetical protein